MTSQLARTMTATMRSLSVCSLSTKNACGFGVEKVRRGTCGGVDRLEFVVAEFGLRSFVTKGYVHR